MQSDGKVSSPSTGTAVIASPSCGCDLSLDPTFGGDGVDETVVEPGPYAHVNGLTVQSDGRILVTGHVTNTAFSVSYFVLLRFRTDGPLDPTFGGATTARSSSSSRTAELGTREPP